MSNIHSSYLTRAFDPATFSDIIFEAISYLKPKSKEFDAIAFCGCSGSLVAPVLAYELGKAMIVVRKLKDTKSHCHREAEGRDCERFLIVDDFITSGDTIRFILDKIKASPIKGEPVGIYLWDARYNNRGIHEGLPIWRA